MQIEIIEVFQEYKKYQSDKKVGVYLIEITKTESANGKEIIVMNGDDIQMLKHYTSGSVLEKNLTELFQKKIRIAFKKHNENLLNKNNKDEKEIL